MRYQLWNKTLEKWVLDEDGNVCVLHSQAEADLALQKVNDIKQLNPERKNDEIEISYIG